MATFLRSDLWVKSVLGQAIAGASVYVCSQPTTNTTSIPPAPLATIYSDVNGLNVIPGSVVISDGFGHAAFYIAGINYTYVVVNGGVIQNTYPDQAPMNVGGGGGGSAITLLTDGTINISQTRLNLVSGSGISMISDGSGNVTIINTAGGGGGTSVTLQTNSVSNVVQTLLNLKPGASLSVTPDNFGGVTFALGNIVNNLVFNNDNTNSIGTIAANRPSTVFAGTSVVAPLVNATTGIQINGAAISGQVLRGNGTNFVSAQLGYGDLSGTPQLAVTKAAVTSNFLTSYTSGTGAFTAAQPAFTDISGSVAAAQLPTPTTTTFGGVKDIAAVTSKFVTSIVNGQPVLGTRVASLNFVIDGGGAVPGTGAYGQINVPVACTVTGWVLTADQSGSAVVDVLRSTYAGFPTTSSIAGTDKPTLSSVQKNENLSEGSWGSTALAAGDQIQVNLNSVTTCTRLNLTIICTIP